MCIRDRGQTPAKPTVPVTVDAEGNKVGGPRPLTMPDTVKTRVMGAVERVLGEEAARGGDLTPEMIQAHGPELAGEVLGAILGDALPEQVGVGDGTRKLTLDLSSIFAALVNKGES